MVEGARQSRHRYTVGRCHHCGAFELHRTSARALIQKVVARLTPLQPMRCPACGTRTLRLPSAAQSRPKAPPLPEPAPPPRSRRERRRRRRLKRRLTAVAWFVGAAATAGALGYLASRG